MTREEAKDKVLKRKAQIIAESVVRSIAETESISKEERLELLRIEYESALAKLRAKK